MDIQKETQLFKRKLKRKHISGTISVVCFARFLKTGRVFGALTRLKKRRSREGVILRQHR